MIGREQVKLELSQVELGFCIWIDFCNSDPLLSREFAQALIKTIKFRENPSPDELVRSYLFGRRKSHVSAFTLVIEYGVLRVVSVTYYSGIWLGKAAGTSWSKIWKNMYEREKFKDRAWKVCIPPSISVTIV